MAERNKRLHRRMHLRKRRNKQRIKTLLHSPSTGEAVRLSTSLFSSGASGSSFPGSLSIGVWWPRVQSPNHFSFLPTLGDFAESRGVKRLLCALSAGLTPPAQASHLQGWYTPTACSPPESGWLGAIPSSASGVPQLICAQLSFRHPRLPITPGFQLPQASNHFSLLQQPLRFKPRPHLSHYHTWTDLLVSASAPLVCSLWPLHSSKDTGEAFALALPAPWSARPGSLQLPRIASFRSLFKCHLFRKMLPMTSNLKLKKGNSSCSPL